MLKFSYIKIKMLKFNFPSNKLSYLLIFEKETEPVLVLSYENIQFGYVKVDLNDNDKTNQRIETEYNKYIQNIRTTKLINILNER